MPRTSPESVRSCRQSCQGIMWSHTVVVAVVILENFRHVSGQCTASNNGPIFSMTSTTPSGACGVDVGGGCIETLGATYSNNEQCTICAHRGTTLEVQAFNVEWGPTCSWDWVQVGSTRFCGSASGSGGTPNGLSVTGGTVITWQTDGGTVRDGWRICAVSTAPSSAAPSTPTIEPTHAPTTSAPAARPSSTPTSAPTIATTPTPTIAPTSATVPANAPTRAPVATVGTLSPVTPSPTTTVATPTTAPPSTATPVAVSLAPSRSPTPPASNTTAVDTAESSDGAPIILIAAVAAIVAVAVVVALTVRRSRTRNKGRLAVAPPQFVLNEIQSPIRYEESLSPERAPSVHANTYSAVSEPETAQAAAQYAVFGAGTQLALGSNDYAAIEYGTQDFRVGQNSQPVYYSGIPNETEDYLVPAATGRGAVGLENPRYDAVPGVDSIRESSGYLLPVNSKDGSENPSDYALPSSLADSPKRPTAYETPSSITKSSRGSNAYDVPSSIGD